jgi:DNA-binding LacI/PurR family transcriptional regulator
MRIRQSIEKHGQWHIGTLVVWPRKMVPEMTPLVETLLLSGKPVVWLDHSNHPHPPDIRRPGFIRCRFSEREGLLRALATLEELGHSRIGYLGRTGYDGWEGKRYQGCVELARRRWPRMTIHRCAVRADELGIRDKPMHWPETDAQPEDWLAAPESISEKERVALDRGELTPTLISHGRQFEDLLHHHPHITAVIVSNQYRACELYSYLRWRGVSIPRDISLVTFDNYLQFQIWPLTTVDFGFGNLGYRAFQAIRGEIPVRIGTNRDMLTEALLINRGSLDAPRSHGFLHSPATPPWYPHRTSL